MDWTVCVESFVKVANNRSFAKTASAMHTTGPTITKRIQWLESHLKVTLLTRSTRQVELTQAGHDFLAQSEPLLQQWNQLKNTTFNQHKVISGVLSLACTRQFGRMFLIPLIAKFRAQHPNVLIRLTSSNSAVNLIEQGIDLYLGLGRFIKDAATTIAIPVKEDFYQCFASPAYIKNHGEPQNVDELKHHHAVSLTQQKTWLLNNESIKPNVVFSSNDSATLLQAAVLGVGVGYFPIGIVRDLYDEAVLQCVLPDYISNPLKIVICHPNVPFKPDRSTLFLNFLKSHFNHS